MENVQESWNMATATMQRLNNLLIQSSFYSQNNDLKGWFRVLMDLRRNLHPFMETKEINEIEEKFKSLPYKWNYYNKIKRQDYSIVYKVFDEIYIIFIDTMKEKGLLMPRTFDASKAIIGG